MDVSKLWYEFADELGRDITYNPVEWFNFPTLKLILFFLHVFDVWSDPDFFYIHTRL